MMQAQAPPYLDHDHDHDHDHHARDHDTHRLQPSPSSAYPQPYAHAHAHTHGHTHTHSHADLPDSDDGGNQSADDYDNDDDQHEDQDDQEDRDRQPTTRRLEPPDTNPSRPRRSPSAIPAVECEKGGVVLGSMGAEALSGANWLILARAGHRGITARLLVSAPASPHSPQFATCPKTWRQPPRS